LLLNQIDDALPRHGEVHHNSLAVRRRVCVSNQRFFFLARARISARGEQEIKRLRSRFRFRG
jgi:hypothetical protein